MHYYAHLFALCMTVASPVLSQHVGIGTNNPKYALDIVNNDLFDVRVTNTASTTVAISMFNSLGAAGELDSMLFNQPI